jgi:DNA invertase Pin-like site-specific DNA recombinase
MASTAIIYVRVSSHRQAEDGLPIASQLDQAKRKVDELDAKLLRVFADEGVSARTDRRPAFQEAIGFCSAQKVDYFVCWDTSRFARNRIDAAVYKKLLRGGGTDVIYVATAIDATTDSGWIQESVLEIMDESHSRRVAADTKRSLMKNAADGYFNGGRTPFGFEVVPEGKRRRLAIVEHEAELVRQMFRMYIEGAGCKLIAMRLNADGLINRGRRWSKNSVTLTLKNTRYIGETIFNRRDHAANRWRPESQWIRAESHEAIVSKEIFMSVHELFKKRTATEEHGSPKSQHAFTGLLTCSACGARMKIETATGRSRRYDYYNCGTAIRGQGCGSRRVDADKLDAFLVERILDSLLTPARIEEMVRDLHELSGKWIQERKSMRESVVKQLRSAETKRDNLFSLLELSGKDTPNLEDITKRLRALKAQIEGLEVALIRIEEAPDFVMQEIDYAAMSTFLRDLIARDSSPSARRIFLADFIDSIVLGPDEIRVNYKPHRLITKDATDVVHSANGWLPDVGLLRTIAIRIPPGLRRAA